MNEIAVVGGTGTIGRLIVAALRGDCAADLVDGAGVRVDAAAVRVVSRHSTEHPADLTTGRGLAQALAGCELVIDASNGPPRRAEPVLVHGARRLAEAAAEAGVRRIVAVSIVGIERVPMGYYRAKVEQEAVLRAGQVPVTIVRSTQFHELVAAAFTACARLRISPRVRGRLQPVAAIEAARAVADVARRPAAEDLVTVAGPAQADVRELARVWCEHDGRRLLPVPVPLPPRVGRALRDGALTCSTPDVQGETDFSTWCNART